MSIAWQLTDSHIPTNLYVGRLMTPETKRASAHQIEILIQIGPKPNKPWGLNPSTAAMSSKTLLVYAMPQREPEYVSGFRNQYMNNRRIMLSQKQVGVLTYNYTMTFSYVMSSSTQKTSREALFMSKASLNKKTYLKCWVKRSSAIMVCAILSCW